MDRFLKELSNNYKIEIIFKKANENAENSLDKYQQLLFKKLDKKEEVK